MVHLYDNREALQLAKKFAELIVNKYGEEVIKKILMFGSRVKGTSRPDSDIDVLIITRDVESCIDLTRVVFDLRMEVHRLISPLVHADDEIGNSFIESIKESSIILFDTGQR